VLFLARRARAGLLVLLSSVLFAALPWALVVTRLSPVPPRTDFAWSAFSVSKGVSALAVLADAAAPSAGLVLAGGALLALAPGTVRRRRGVLAWAGLASAALLGSFAFSRFDPAWNVRWSWDRILVVTLAPVLPVLAEALQEAVGMGVAISPVGGASLE
jgi:hypothetical protein